MLFNKARAIEYMQRYNFSDSGTTLALSKPTPALLERHAALRACMAAGIEAIRPGSRASAVAEAIRQTLNRHGITASFPHGHGFGLEVRDYPILVADNGLRLIDDCLDEPSDLPLEPDMVLNLEAAIFMPGLASLHLEQSLVVTSQGSRALLPQDRSAPFVVDP
jgi:Xaa-Pro aminopeptidase